jgi:uncharacterized Zn ribbon protein
MQANVMKTRFITAVQCGAAALLIAASAGVAAQDNIYRCPSKAGITTYTNNKVEADNNGCTLMTGGNVTVVLGTNVKTAPATATTATGTRVASAPQAGSRIDTPEQRSRDNDAKAILESELKKVEATQAQLLKDFNGGEPEKRGEEMRNNQKYIDRVAEMKSAIARNDSDIAGIKREIGRVK